ncbi:MAG TPA: EamA family transporter, partial [Spirochaetia bacterium]|nr:EamA family transporter [Spirochaetia bacterium]
MPRPQLHPSSPAAPYVVIGVGMAAVSSASILISLARIEGVPALAIAALRMLLAAAVAAPLALLRARRELRATPWR